jgi:hypothetical protein
MKKRMSGEQRLDDRHLCIVRRGTSRRRWLISPPMVSRPWTRKDTAGDWRFVMVVNIAGITDV